MPLKRTKPYNKAESAHGCQVPVYGLKIVRIATRVGNEEDKTTEIVAGGLVAPGEGWLAWQVAEVALHHSSEKWKEEKRGFSPSTGFPPRPLLAISGIHTFARTHISLPALATLNLNLQLASLRLPLLWPVYTRREKLRCENRCHVCYLWHRSCVCFRKRRIIVLYLYFYYYRRQKISKLGHFSNELKRNLRGEEVRLKLNRSKVWLCGIFN